MFKSNKPTECGGSRNRKYSLPESQKDPSGVQIEGLEDFERQIRERIDQNLAKNSQKDQSTDMMKYQLKNLSFFKSLNTSKGVSVLKPGSGTGQQEGGNAAKARQVPVTGGGPTEGTGGVNLLLSRPDTGLGPPSFHQKYARTGSFESHKRSRANREKSVLFGANELEYSLHEMRHNRAKSDVHRRLLSAQSVGVSPVHEMAAKAGLNFHSIAELSGQGQRPAVPDLAGEHPFDELMVNISQKKRQLLDTTTRAPTPPGSEGGAFQRGGLLARRAGSHSRHSSNHSRKVSEENQRQVLVGLRVAEQLQPARDKWDILMARPSQQPSAASRGGGKRPQSPASINSTATLPHSKNIQEQKFDWRNYPSGQTTGAHRLWNDGAGPEKVFGATSSWRGGSFSALGSNKLERPFESSSQASKLLSQLGRPSSATHALVAKNGEGGMAFFKKKSIVEETVKKVEKRSNPSLLGNKTFGRPELLSYKQSLKTGTRDAKFLESKHKLLQLNSSVPTVRQPFAGESRWGDRQLGDSGQQTPKSSGLWLPSSQNALLAGRLRNPWSEPAANLSNFHNSTLTFSKPAPPLLAQTHCLSPQHFRFSNSNGLALSKL